MARFWLAMVVVLALAAITPATADSWLPPAVETYESSDGQYRLTVTPRGLTGPLGYFEDRVDGKEPAGQRPGASTEARGVLERRVDGGWQTVWARPLVNDVSPVEAMVSPRGDFVVTFDNWHSTGYGDDVVVIYGSDGALIRKMALTDFLPEDYVAALPRSISSMPWAGQHRIEGRILMLAVGFPGYDDRERYIHIRIDLATGRAEPPKGPAWEKAKNIAAGVNQRLAAERANEVAWLRAPLVAPTTSEDYAMGRYLFEAHRRLAPIWPIKEPPFEFELSLPAEERHGRDAEILIGILEDADFGYSDEFIAGSFDQDDLVKVLVAGAPGLPRGGLKGKRLYFLVSVRNWPALIAAFEGTGAELVQVNPDQPIPQRPERMPD